MAIGCLKTSQPCYQSVVNNIIYFAEEDKMETENITSVNPEKLKESSENNKEGAKQPSADGERMETEAKMDVDGDVVETMTVERGSESWFHTRLDNLSGEVSAQADVESVRKELEEQLATWSQVIIKGFSIRAGQFW